MGSKTPCPLCGRVHSEEVPDTKKVIARDYCSGYIGGCEIAVLATDSEIDEIITIQDNIGRLSNQLRSLQMSILRR